MPGFSPSTSWGGSRAPVVETGAGAGAAASEADPPWPPGFPDLPWLPQTVCSAMLPWTVCSTMAPRAPCSAMVLPSPWIRPGGLPCVPVLHQPPGSYYRLLLLYNYEASSMQHFCGIIKNNKQKYFAYTTGCQKFGIITIFNVLFIVFMSLLLTKAAFVDHKKYSRNGNIVKYYFNLK